MTRIMEQKTDSKLQEWSVVLRVKEHHAVNCACVIATVKLKCVTPVPVNVVYIVRLRIVFWKAALQKRGSIEPMEPPLDPPLQTQEHMVCASLTTGHNCSHCHNVQHFSNITILCICFVVYLTVEQDTI